MQDFDFNPAVPQAARIYSHLLAGKDHISQKVRAVFRDRA